jgi:hypothetical protein
MANVLDRYGIKEVADVTFYKLNDNGQPMYPVLFLDTLKVSTIEQTAETAEARGGKGNGSLIAWDYNKEINVTLEDALFSAKSMAIMFGNGVAGNFITPASDSVETSDNAIMKTEKFVATSASASGDSAAAMVAGWTSQYIAPDGKQYTKQHPKFYPANLNTTDSTSAAVSAFVKDAAYFCSYDLCVTGSVIEISANSFPGTYYVTGDTFARNENSGRDEFFQFIIPKAKVTSENTITLEADGDPSVFNMNLKVLRPSDGVMMKLVKYDLLGAAAETATSTSETYHNHTLF